MKGTILLLSLIFFFACSVQKNSVITDEKTKREILIGKCDREAFQKEQFKNWFESEYNSYEPDPVTINELDERNLMSEINIKIIFGTWCGDSRRELPRFFKIIDALKNRLPNFELIGVDTKKSCRCKLLDGIEFTRIPTFIFYSGGKEIGRIVESTKISLEDDILEIIGN